MNKEEKLELLKEKVELEEALNIIIVIEQYSDQSMPNIKFGGIVLNATTNDRMTHILITGTDYYECLKHTINVIK